MDIQTSGIMFPTFPTLAEVVKTSYINLLGADVEEIELWHVVAWDPTTQRYSDEDWEAMDETNWDAIRDGIPNLQNASYDYNYNRETLGPNWHWQGLDDVLAAGAGTISGISGTLLILAPDPGNGEINGDGHWGTDPDDPNREIWVEQSDLSLAWEHIRECANRLESYPILDEDAYSAREYAAWEEYAPDALRTEVRGYHGRDFAALDLSDDEREAIEVASEGDNELLPILGSHLDYYHGFSGEYSPSFADVFASLYFGNVADVKEWKREDAVRLRSLIWSHLPENYCRQCGKDTTACLPTCPRKVADNLTMF